ncbi:dot2 [Candida margitis]|uniref:dot2 n=1 Tax=Candida margitis TaxID=1775924 RepID=UPI0022269C21|nr:dot2 [Candida margitis]KAI5970288.1 dot2 [Candida margitis]
MDPQSDRDAYQQLGQRLNQQHSEQLSTQLQVFRSALINFVNDYSTEIKSNGEFRSKFNQISQSIGMDPLDLLIYSNSNSNATSRSNTSKRDSNNFVTGLSVKIVEICQETRDLNGGLISIRELQSILTDNSSDLKIDISTKHIEQAITILNSMGQNYQLIVINNESWLKFSSIENLSNDQLKIYELCGFMGGFVTMGLIRDNYGWDKIRCKSVIDEMIMNGILWVDEQGEDEWHYWEPSWISH